MDGNVLGTHIAIIHIAFLFPEVGVERCYRANLSVCPGLSNQRAISGSFIFLFSTENKPLNLPPKKCLQYIMEHIVGMNEEPRSHGDCLPGVSSDFVFLPKQ